MLAKILSAAAVLTMFLSQPCFADSDTATGFSDKFDLEAAIKDAVSKLPRRNPDIGYHVRITAIEAYVGGFTRRTGLLVTVDDTVDNGH